jgi:hypothetical protein
MQLAARFVGTHHEELSKHHGDKAAEIIQKHNLRNRSLVDNWPFSVAFGFQRRGRGLR